MKLHRICAAALVTWATFAVADDLETQVRMLRAEVKLLQRQLARTQGELVEIQGVVVHTQGRVRDTEAKLRKAQAQVDTVDRKAFADLLERMALYERSILGVPRGKPDKHGVSKLPIAAASECLVRLSTWRFTTRGRDAAGVRGYHIFTTLENGYPKDIKLLDASITFADMFGDEMLTIELTREKHLPRGASAEHRGRYSAWSPTGKGNRMAHMKQENIVATLRVKKIMFTDNTVLEFWRLGDPPPR